MKINQNVLEISKKIFIYSDHPRMVEFLFKNGADINAKNNPGNTPLIEAVRWGSSQIENCSKIDQNY